MVEGRHTSELANWVDGKNWDPVGVGEEGEFWVLRLGSFILEEAMANIRILALHRPLAITPRLVSSRLI